MTHDEELLPAGLAAAIRDAFGWTTVEPLELLHGGEWNRVLRLLVDPGQVVVRIAHPTTTMEALARRHAVHEWAHPSGTDPYPAAR